MNKVFIVVSSEIHWGCFEDIRFNRSIEKIFDSEEEALSYIREQYRICIEGWRDLKYRRLILIPKNEWRREYERVIDHFPTEEELSGYRIKNAEYHNGIETISLTYVYLEHDVL